jgi:serine/threonine-protein kinase HipA
MMSTKIKLLHASTPQGYAGRLAKESQLVWRYETDHSSCEISLTMPMRLSSYAANMIHPIFAMNLPEGEQFHRIRTRFAKQFAKLDEMALLSIVGHNQIGRVQLSETQGGARSNRQALLSLEQLKATKATNELFDDLFDQYYDAGISGAQPKLLLPDANTPLQGRDTVRIPDLIVKTGGAEYPQLSQNEYVCMLVAKKAGLEVPEFHLSDDGQLFIMRRFDLVPRANGGMPTQLGFEDFAVLSNANYDTTGDYKYRGNYEGIARLIDLLCQLKSNEQKAKFFEQLTLSVMLRNGDAHLKNFGLLYDSPDQPETVRLSPLYDVVTTSAYDTASARTGRMMTDRTLALKLNKTNSYPDREVLLRFGREYCGVQQPERVIERVGQAMLEVMRDSRSLFTREFGERMAAEWETGRSSVMPHVKYVQ